MFVVDIARIAITRRREGHEMVVSWDGGMKVGLCSMDSYDHLLTLFYVHRHYLFLIF